MDNNTLEAIKFVAMMLAVVGGVWAFVWYLVTIMRL